jgi:TPR repeat protein
MLKNISMLLYFGSIRYAKLTVVSALLLVAGIYAACAQPRIGEFDWDRYRALTLEKRQQYDLLFFNEMETWNSNSVRYGLEGFGTKREQDFRRMAANGYLPAYVAVRIFGFEGGYVFSDAKAYEMLLQAAESGTGSERCALFRIRWQARGWSKDQSFLENIDQATLDRFCRMGVDEGHFGCQYVYAIRYQHEQDGFPKDLALAEKYFIQSAAQGYFPAQRGLAYVYRKRGIASARDAERVLCWAALADQHKPGAAFFSAVYDVERAARSKDSPIHEPHAREKLESLLKEWAPIGGELIPKKIPTVSECLTLEHNAN